MAPRLILRTSCLTFVLTALVFAGVSADTTPQALPFAQDWSNTGLISVNDVWSSVPGVIGIRGDNLTAVTGADPQTVLADETTIDVNANQSSPNTLTIGGVAEFDGIPNPVVALQGSGTADAPFLLLTLDASGAAGIVVSFNLRDIDGSADNAVQPVALQYRVGSSGNFTNLPAGFVADATEGPSIATLVTPVSATLPTDAEGQPVVQVRIITTNALGSDEWVGIDDLSVASSSAALSGVGSATPSTVTAGGSTLLTVAVAPASNPPSTGIAVVANLSSIGGSPGQQFFDDGTSGDVTPSDNTFSFQATVLSGVSPGLKTLPVSISDAESRQASASISLTVEAPTATRSMSWGATKALYR